MGVVLVGGGARSGKSRFALDYTGTRFERLAFVATAEAGDDEMRARIERHRSERGVRWTTIEEPLDIVGALARESERFDGFVVDCLTIWLSNVLLDGKRDVAGELDRLRDHLQGRHSPTTVLITNEVGCGIVPENALARRYRDLAGEMNQSIARVADEIYWMVFGVPLTVKSVNRER